MVSKIGTSVVVSALTEDAPIKTNVPSLTGHRKLLSIQPGYTVRQHHLYTEYIIGTSYDTIELEICLYVDVEN